MTKSAHPVRSLRLFLAALPLACAVGCGSSAADRAGASTAVSVNFSGTARAWTVPATVTAPAFSGVQAELVGFEALADVGQSAPTVLASAAVQAASSSCAEDGCPFRVDGVQLSQVSRGLFAKLSVPSGPAMGKWQDTFSMVLNANQVQRGKEIAAATTAFGPATLSPVASVANFAQLAGLSSEALLARGACLAFVTPTRDASDTLGKGVLRALVRAVDGASELRFFYPDDTYRQLQNGGTNVDGAVLVVGPATTSTRPASYAHGVSVVAQGSNLRFVDQAVLLRPNTFIITNLLPLQ